MVTATSTSVASPTTTASPTDPAATAKAQAAVLQFSDFPAGWKALTPAEGGGLNLETVWQELGMCLGLPAVRPAGVATSPTFLRGLATQARSTVEYTSQAAAGAVATALSGPKFQTCANDAFAADVKRSAPQGGVPGPVAIAPLAYPSIAAATTSSFRITVTVNLDELKVPLFQDFFVVFKGSSVVRMLFLNPGSEFPQDLERTLVDKVLGRT
jgi:hypothetical protein